MKILNTVTTCLLTDEEIKNHPFIGSNGEASFYRFVVENIIGKNFDEITCDCREIDIAQNIQEKWYTLTKLDELNRRNFNLTEDEFLQFERNQSFDESIKSILKEVEVGLAMFLLNQGPKAPADLPDNTIRFSDKFVKTKE